MIFNVWAAWVLQKKSYFANFITAADDICNRRKNDIFDELRMTRLYHKTGPKRETVSGARLCMWLVI